MHRFVRHGKPLTKSCTRFQRVSRFTMEHHYPHYVIIHRPLVSLLEPTKRPTASFTPKHCFSTGNEGERISAASMTTVDTGLDDDDNKDSELNDIDDFDDILSIENEETELDDLLPQECKTKLVYRETLNNWYRANFDVSLNSAFETSRALSNEETPPSPIMWKSVFICPITGHRVEAKTLPGMVHSGSFPSKKLANQAAAFEAINFFCPVETISNPKSGSTLAHKRLQMHYMKEHKIVLKDSDFAFNTRVRKGKKNGGSWWTAEFICPITRKVFPAMKLPTHDDLFEKDKTIWYRRKRDAVEAACAKALWATQTGCPGMDPNEQLPYKVISTEPLRLWYRKYHELELNDQHFVTTHGNWNASLGDVWTASFICPISGDRYDSGWLPSVQNISEGGCQWYKRKKIAVAAAALRAYDILRFEAIGSKDLRYCQEDPSEYVRGNSVEEDITMTTSSQDTNYNEVVDQTVVRVTSDNQDQEKDGVDMEQDEEEHLVEFVPQKEGGYQCAMSTPSTLDLVPQTLVQGASYSDVVDQVSNGRMDVVTFHNPDHEKDEVETGQDLDEEEYIVGFVPRKVGEYHGTMSIPSTLDLVAQTWVRSTLEHTRSAPNDSSERTWSTNSPRQSHHEVIQCARQWLSQQTEINIEQTDDTSRFDKVNVPSARIIGKRLLQSLAASKQTALARHDASEIQEVAGLIIDFLWSSPESTPDADCYALYIHCLQGGYQRVHRTARKIYDAMSKGIEFNGHVMPPPNVSVFNSLVQRKAEFGIRTNLAELETAQVNRDTFLSCLAAIAHATGQGSDNFDSQYVLDCIREMKNRGIGNTEADMQVQIDIFNAPMRWSADPSEALRSRPYSRPIPWDDIGKIFASDNVFNDENPAVQEARAIENWFRTIDAQGFGSAIRPNIETYESVVQAWIRTGTSNGLDRAEAILDELCSKQTEGLTLRLQTVQPFIAASAFAGDYARVDRWIEKMNEINHEMFRESIFTISSMLARVSAKQVDFARGDECLRLLRDAIEMARTQKNPNLDARAFIIAIEAFCKEVRDKEQYMSESNAGLGIQEVVELFDQFLVSSLENSNGENLAQVHHLLDSAPIVYYFSFSAWCEIQSTGNSSLLQSLEWAEMIVRRSGEHCMLLEQKLPMKSTVDTEKFQNALDAGFPFNVESVLRQSEVETWPDYYRFVIDATTKLYMQSDDASNELLGLSVLASKIAKRHFENQNVSGTPSTTLANHLNKFHKAHPLVTQIEKEFGENSSTNISRHNDNPRSSRYGDASNHGAHVSQVQRRKRIEKTHKAPNRRPRKASSEPRRTIKSAKL